MLESIIAREGTRALEPKTAAQDPSHISRTLHLTYPPSLVGEPILYRLIRHFDLTINLRSAQLGMEEGWIEIQAIGAEQEIDRAIHWLTDEGLQVTPSG
jgi:NIL domain